jgi:hypothetical protein
MAKQDVPDLTHLTGREIKEIAEGMTAAKLKTILSARQDIAAMKSDEFQRIVDLAAAAAARDGCGGLGCG